MNNLLRTLTESRVKSALPETDLKLLLTSVKDSRRQNCDAKLSDPFYDSLEGLLLDLRTVTMDNRDPEAFLKPVLKSDVPDYYDVISTPMDLQTMLRKVKQKSYKSKREFEDDLDLIWKNCFIYNATENHPLRSCAKRLKAKAQKLLKNITDRKERVDPSIPPEIANVSKVNGYANGHVLHRSPSVASRSDSSVPKHSSPMKIRKSRHGIPFSESPAIVRSQTRMATFLKLDRDIDSLALNSSPEAGPSSLGERLTEFALSDSDEADSEDSTKDGEIGEKRKLNGIAEHRPRKRTRFSPQHSYDESEILDLWWHSMQSDTVIGNGLPQIGYSSSDTYQTHSAASAKLRPKRQKRTKMQPKNSPPRSLLQLMNNNIRTMKRVRKIHGKFAALNTNSNNGEDEGASTPALVSNDGSDDVVDEKPWKPKGSGIELGSKNASDCLHWMGRKVLEHQGFQGTSKVALDVLAGVTSEYLLNVGRTIRFLSDKYSNTMTAEEIILHTLFESGVTRIQDLERYVKDDVVRHGTRMSELEKKLVGAYSDVTTAEALNDDALFGDEEEEEDGAFAMGGFADELGDDFDFFGFKESGIEQEYGLKSLSIPKSLLKSKNKGGIKDSRASANPAEPPPPFPPPPPFIALTSDKLNDQIGLLRPYYQSRFAAIPTPTAGPPAALYPVVGGPPPYGGIAPGIPVPPPGPGVKPPVVTLADDQPHPMQVKMGALGQIIKVAPPGATKKKAKASKEAAPIKSEAAEVTGGGGGGIVGGTRTPAAGTPVPPQLTGGQAPAKKKKGPGPGSGVGRKKAAKIPGGLGLPPVVAAKS